MTFASLPATLFGDDLVADPHSIYAQLRDADPVHRTVTPDGAPVWVVTRYEDVRAVLADPRLSLNKSNAQTPDGYQSSMPPELDAHLLNMDPPDHTRLRRLVAKAFTPRRVEALRDRVQTMTGGLLATMAGPRVDLMQALAVPLPMGVICELLGVPEEDRRDFRSWTDTLLSAAATTTDSRAAMRQMHKYLTDIIQDKRSRPADDLLSALIHARDDRDSLTEPELLSLAFLLLFAGYNNATYLIGNTALGLMLDPKLLKAVQDDTVPIRAVIEESLRWNSPSPLGVRRFALEDVAIGGTVIPAGSRVWVSIASANRDETKFPSPETFDPHRTTAHLAFGHGIHYCLGAPLARMEAEIAIPALVRRFPTLRLDIPENGPDWLHSFRKRGLKTLPVTC
ncbi:cytochrome P450 [Streptomyces griseochromogenes]|uniref:Cytochrome n=1 Tax=Streptomyces griseochromogenes TaxID=68214 RepID=A0A1B1AZN6_9ACTN|nr:cytochrome P450 [Streptomyces griseochromogenes]ANP52043.1 cytochrome [Streptomyces griseochromogenes]MBP2056253.1 cytochrome P450 [Streptomyces griseochromogenes]